MQIDASTLCLSREQLSCHCTVAASKCKFSNLVLEQRTDLARALLTCYLFFSQSYEDVVIRLEPVIMVSKRFSNISGTED